MALTKEGYKREKYEDIFARLESKTKEKFGEDTNTSERSVIGIIIHIMAWILSLVWQDNENVYYSAFRKTATGKSLDMLLPHAGITRNQAEYATGPVQLTGAANTLVEAGFIVGKKSEILYETLEDVTFDGEGLAIVDIMAQEPGISGNAEIGEVSEIINPVDNVESVTNLVAITGGKEKETDQEARERANISTEGLGSATTASVRAELLKTTGVRAAFVDENYESEINEFGTPQNAIQAFVLGGKDDDIANAIFKKKAGGIKPHGTTYVNVTDDSGRLKPVGFTRATTLPIHVKVILTTNSAFETDGKAKVVTAIVKYIGGQDADSNEYVALNMGEDVILSKLIAKIYSVNGIDDVDVQLSTDGITYTAENVVISMHQVAQTNANIIEVI